MSLNPADARFAAHLRTLLPEERIRAPEPRYLVDPRDIAHGQAGLVALPKTVEEVAVLIRAAGEARVGVIPYGGGTGLVGAQVMPEGPAPMVLSLERMSAIRAVYPEENVIIAEAGAILADVQAAAVAANRLFPLSLASEGSCRIGGNLATNAGGVNVLRYGNTRDLCLGLEAVLPDGSIWHGLTRLRKDNTGYDLRNLLVGAEGTLGVITAAALKLAPIPAGRGTALIAVQSPRAALDMLSLARDRLGEGISAFELIHRQGLEFLAEVLPQVRRPWADPPEWCVLIDVGLAQGLDPEQALTDLFEAALERDLATDGLIAQNEAQAQEFWTVREHLPEANRKIGSVTSHDVSLPLSVLPDFIEDARAMVAEHGSFRINCFGHLGDGNLHFNLFPAAGRARADYANVKDAVRAAIHDMVVRMGGSFSAEHGVGRAKVKDLERYGDPARLTALRAIKAALDPVGIMNPGAVLA